MTIKFIGNTHNLTVRMDVKDLYDKGLLTPEEKVIYQTTQRRVKKAIYPASVIVTDRQIIVYSPKMVGANTSAYGYGRLQNIKIQKKFFTSSIEIHTMTDVVNVGGLPSDAGSSLLRAMRSVKP